MKAGRSLLVLLLAAGIAIASAPAGATDDAEARAKVVLRAWYGLVLELVRHTPTYSPPVASRSFAYVGVAAYEAVADGADGMRSLAGQLNGLEPPPGRTGEPVDDAVVLHAVLSEAVGSYFGNTGPAGQRAMAVAGVRLGEAARGDLPDELVARSMDHGRAIARHILEWSRDDGGAEIVNMGFPLQYQPGPEPWSWVPTSLVSQQQTPLLPAWGENRAFAMPDGAACPLPPPPAYSEDAESDFHLEALEVYETVNELTDEQEAIARFWSDDPMLSPTPPGHWISIALQIMEAEESDLATHVDVLARLGVTLADSFIGCWYAKYEYDLLRPSTYIRRHIDSDWREVLITPPFPEYPSGHSTQSGAAAVVLTDLFGEDFAFADATHVRDGLPARDYRSFWEAAEEAGISRLYGGIHFRAAIERGLDQGRCIGAYATALRTRN